MTDFGLGAVTANLIWLGIVWFIIRPRLSQDPKKEEKGCRPCCDWDTIFEGKLCNCKCHSPKKEEVG